MTDTQAAYLAGIVDGEGCIYVGKSGNNYMSAWVAICMTHKPTIEWIGEVTGCGMVIEHRTKQQGRRKAWLWRLMSQQAVPFLRELLPHLVTKKFQAEKYIALMQVVSENFGSNRPDSPAYPIREQLFKELRADKRIEFN